jgi:hypothetical protein
MAGIVLRSVGYGGVGGQLSPTHKRAVFTLSDGTRAAIVADPNQTGIANDGGDSTGVAKFYVYTSPTGTVWTLRATVTPTTAPLANSITWASCVGTNNNLHLCWRGTTGGIYYKLITFGAGPTYTAGADETVLSVFPANGDTSYVRRLDIDVAGSTNNAVIAAYCALTASATVSNRRCELRLFTRSNTPTWVAATTTPFTAAGQWYYLGSEDVTITADAAGPDGSNQINCVVMHTRKRNDGADLGDMLWIWKTTTTTGASVSITANTPTGIGSSGINTGVGGGIRTYTSFASGNGEFTIIGLVSITPSVQVFIWRFTVSSGGVRTDLIARQLTNYPNNQFDRTGVFYGWGGSSYGSDTGVVYGRTANFIYGIPVQFFRTPSHTVRVGQINYWDEQYTFNNVRGQSIHGTGNNRNFSFNKHDVLWYAGLKGSSGAFHYKVEFFQSEITAAPRNVTPAASSTFTTDRPNLAADHNWGTVNLPQSRTKMQWQVASDAGFTTNLRTITEADLDFILALNTAVPNNARVTTVEPTNAVSELFQGTWYVRARSVTELGDFGAYSTGQSFLVTHPPTVTNTFPRADAIFDYGGSGAITFSWTFTDPSPFDFQTAYQIIVEDAVSGSIILDTTKITTANHTATHTIPIGGKDIQLRWKMKVWDSDDVVGPESPYQTFYAVDKPAIVIDFPGPTGVNELTVDDSSATVTVGTWVGITNGTTSRDAGTFRSAPGSIGSSAIGAGTVLIGTQSNLYQVNPTEEVTYGGYSRAGTTGRSIRPVIRYYDIANVYLNTLDITGTNVTDNNAGYTALNSVTTFVPQGAFYARLCIERLAMGAAETFTIDDLFFNTTGNINSANATVQWTTTIGGGRTQTNYRVVISQGSTIVYDSGWILSSADGHTIPVTVLQNSSNYSVTVSVRDNLNLENSATSTFSTSWTVPAATTFTLSGTNYESLGYVQVAWTNATVDADFVAYNVYRRKFGTTAWTLIDQEVVNQSNYTFNDYLVGSNTQHEYAVTQLVDRFGSLVEATKVPTSITPASSYYWLIHPSNSTFSVQLRNVTDDPYTVEYDQVSINIINRGRHIDYGDRLGISGAISAQLRDLQGGLTARQQREALVQLRDLQVEAYLRNPFGDVLLVGMGNISVSRIAGVGVAEYVDVQFPYEEVGI